MDSDVVLSKLESLRRSLHRIEEKTPSAVEVLVDDYDRQDIIALNLERAVQTCVDIALHIISDLEAPAPDTMAHAFRTLEAAGSIDPCTAERMVKAVGFRNTAVHAYQAIDWTIVYRIITEHLDDFRAFARQVLTLTKHPPPSP